MSSQWQTIEVRAIWGKTPSVFADGMMQWVAEVVVPPTSERIADSPAYPIDSDVVDDGESSDAGTYLRPNLSRMNDDTQMVVEAMHKNFVNSLERKGWTRAGHGPDWFNVHLTRAVPN